MATHGPMRNERAETSLQAVILVPVVFLMVFMCFHIAALRHQSHVAMAIAIRGADIAGSSDISAGSDNRAVSEMSRMASDLGARLVRAPSINHSQDSVTVQVDLRVNGALPFLPEVASATTRQTRERFVREQDRE